MKKLRTFLFFSLIATLLTACSGGTHEYKQTRETVVAAPSSAKAVSVEMTERLVLKPEGDLIEEMEYEIKVKLDGEDPEAVTEVFEDQSNSVKSSLGELSPTDGIEVTTKFDPEKHETYLHFLFQVNENTIDQISFYLPFMVPEGNKAIKTEEALKAIENNGFEKVK